MANYTYADFKRDLRRDAFPDGEAVNLVAAHDNAILSGLIDIQKWVECFQQNNTTLFPQCSTLFDCGLTVFDAPRGRVKQVSVIDSLPATEVPARNDSGDTIQTKDALDTVPYVMGRVGFNQSQVYTKTFTLAGVSKIYVGMGYNSTNQIGQQGLSAAIVKVNGSIVFAGEIGDGNNGVNPGDFLSAFPSPWGHNNGSYGVAVDTNLIEGVNTLEITVTESYGSDHDIFARVLSVTDLVAENDPSDYCSEIIYDQLDAVHVQKYQSKTKGCNTCGRSMGFLYRTLISFFGLFDCGKKLAFDEPTGDGVPENLPRLPLGVKYAQKSTDGKCRARYGRWAVERGQIHLMPWIQSSETAIVKWDGIKRNFQDSEPISKDPSLLRAVTLYVQADHARRYDRSPGDAAEFERLYATERALMMHECREETRVRGREASHARGDITSQVTALFYNDEQKASAVCPTGTTGRSITITVPSGTVASAVSVGDANSIAYSQAKADAENQLNCQNLPSRFLNRRVSATANCTTADNAPAPDGEPVTIYIDAGTYSSAISVDDADQQARLAAQALADAQIQCVWWNRAVSYTAICPAPSDLEAKVDIAAHTISSTISQSDADEIARLQIARVRAMQQCEGTVLNEEQVVPLTRDVKCIALGGSDGTIIGSGGSETLTASGTVAAGTYSGFTLVEANQLAYNRALQLAQVDMENKVAFWQLVHCGG